MNGEVLLSSWSNGAAYPSRKVIKSGPQVMNGIPNDQRQQFWDRFRGDIICGEAPLIKLGKEAVLVDDEGEHPMRAGDVATFPKGDGNGHVLQNRSAEACVFIAVGGRGTSDCHYPDIDMHLAEGVGEQRRKDGSRF